ncbi:MAG: DUF5050 domain-containing protein [Lachnospiraceae bacterium]|nr:DUF5050 domain-containing protein [Lachnospiraceae bacterium]
MNAKLKLALILGGIFLCLGGLFVLSHLSGRIPDNPPGTFGNTAGNLYNSGLFCESDGKIYFANAYDNGSLYSMNTDESEMKKLHEGNTHYLNAGGDYLYFLQLRGESGGAGLGYLRGITGMYRIRKDGKQVTGLSRDALGCLKLVDNSLYYQHYTKSTGVTLHRIDTDKKNDLVLVEKNISPAATYQGQIYYGGLEADHYLYSLDMTTGTNSVAMIGNLCYPIVEDGYVYYIDIGNNYRLCRIDLMNPESGAVVLTQDRVDLYNVYGNYIFYQRNSESAPALVRMNIDGSNPEIVAEGNYTNVNCTSGYTYFQLFGEDVPIYRTPTYGAVNVTTFDAARDAALANLE